MSIKDYCKKGALFLDVVTLNIPIKEIYRGVYIKSITTTMELDDDLALEDLALNWDYNCNVPNAKEDLENIINRFYVEEMYLPEIRAKLLEVGFSEAAANSVVPSESGMQSAGRASYDHELYDEIKAAWKA